MVVVFFVVVFQSYPYVPSENPLIRFSVTHQRSEPSFKPRLRSDRPGSVVLAILVMQLCHQVVNDIRKILQIEGAQVFTDGDAQPELVVVLAQLQTQVAKKIDQLTREAGINLLPVEHDPGSPMFWSVSISLSPKASWTPRSA